MYNIQIMVLGKFKENFWANAEAEYLKRLKPYAKIQIFELPEESFSEKDDREKVKQKEAEKILKKIPTDGIIIAMHERGKNLTSTDFAKFLQENSSRGEKITFIFGGPLGLHESILQKANRQISLSSLTFPHQLARVILVEQIYRAATINASKIYHY